MSALRKRADVSAAWSSSMSDLSLISAIQGSSFSSKKPLVRAIFRARFFSHGLIMPRWGSGGATSFACAF
eukprot:4604614-Alexandrium_andersonii.AAC.1